MPVVDYLIAAGCLPARSGLAYDYILAGDGVFVCASNSLVEYPSTRVHAGLTILK